MALKSKFARKDAITILSVKINGQSPELDPCTKTGNKTYIPGFNPLSEDDNPKVIKGDKAKPKRKNAYREARKEANECASYRGKFGDSVVISPPIEVQKDLDIYVHAREKIAFKRNPNSKTDWHNYSPLPKRKYQEIPYGIENDKVEVYTRLCWI